MSAIEHRRSTPQDRGVWLALMIYCVQQENHGRIKGARLWTDFETVVVFGVPRALLDGQHLLWKFSGDDLEVADYPEEHHEAKEVASKRSVLLNRLRWAKERLSDAESAEDAERIAVLKQQISEAESELHKLKVGNGLHKGKDKGKTKDKDKDNGKGKQDRNAAEDGQRPQTLEQVKTYAASIGLPESEADKFFDHFTANGWRQGGRTALRSWQAALRNWARRAGKFNGAQKSSSGGGAAAAFFDPSKPNAHTGGLPVFEPETEAEHVAAGGAQ